MLLILFACGISSDGSGKHDVGLAPVPTEPGTPLGPTTSELISTDGGTISTPDGALSITIPAGAVTSPTEFTITPIANTARGAVAGAFRLGPEGATFALPVTLTFRGPELYPQQGSVDDVGVVYQDRSGFWLPVEPATRNAVANTVAVETDHFSDWALAWTSGTPVAAGSIRIQQTVGIPFNAQGTATVYLREDTPKFTSYVLAGTLTVPATITVGSDVCVPDQTTKSWVNTAEIDKDKAVFRWGTGVNWMLTCTAPGGAVTTRIMPALFDTMGINLSQCPGSYDPGQYAELDFLKGAYTSSCGYEGALRGTWDLRGYQILVDPTSALVTTEAGGTATFQISLNKPPTANVTVPLSSSDPTEGTVPASVTFSPSNWSTPQTVTVTGVNDFVDDDDVAYTLVTFPATTPDPHYEGIDPEDVGATNVDDDTAGLTLEPTSGLVTTEAGGPATFRVSLTSEPLQDVVVSFTSSDTTEGTVSPASLTFTAANWNTAQTVTLTGVNDFVDDGDVAYTVQAVTASADPKYVGLTGSVAATNQNDDHAGYSLVPAAGLVTTEPGGTATFQLSLTSEPFADVTIALTSSDTTEGTVAPASVTFTAASWNTPRTVTVTGVNDFVDDGDVAYSIQLVGTSTDAGYNGRTGSISVSNTDDDTAGFTATPPAGLVTTEAGGTATFQLALSSQPLSDVVVALSSSDTTEGAVLPATVTFTPATWNVAQTVTLAGVDDFVADGVIPYTAQLLATSADPLYAGRTGSVAATNADNDFAGITVGAPSGTSTSEAGTSVTFTVVLTSQPTADVTIPLSSLDTTEGTVSPAGVVFTAANWNVPQTVTVTGVDDLVADGPQLYTVAIGPAASADGGYAGKDPADLGFTNTDNDFADIAIGAPSGISTSETGTSVTFTVVLTSQPTADVSIPLSSSDTTEGTVAPAGVVFTAANWNVPQTVMVTGVDDLVADGTQPYTVAIGPAASADGGYAGKDPADLGFTNTDDDNAGIAVSAPSGSSTSEAGTSVTFTVVLTSQPTADVTIPLSSSDTTEGTVSPAGVTFTAANWNVPQIVTVTGVDDLVADGTQPYTVAIGTAASADLGYAGKDPADLGFTNTDNDNAGITVSAPSGTVTSETGTSVTFTLVLTSQPTADVTVPISSSDTTEGAVSPASVVFTTASWNVPQTVTVTGLDDLLADGTQTYTVAIGPATSADTNYANKNPADFTFTNTDNDVAGLVATPSSGLVTTEAGGAATFLLKLSSQPTADVVVAVSSSDPTEGTVAPASVTFTAANWSVAQTVTVLGVDDPVADGAIAYAVLLSASSTDTGYQGRTGSVAVTNSDNDLAGITVGAPSGTSTSEAGTSVTFTVVLTSQPTADVTIPLASLDATEGTVSPASVVFSAANWNVAQTVTVTGADDLVADGTQAYTVAIGPATSTDTNYLGQDPADLVLTNTDNDAAGLVATPSSGLVTTEVGGPAATFQLKLSSQPTADVVVAVSSNDTTEGTVSPASVTFTVSNWNAAQTVTVTGVDDALADGTIAYTVQLSAASADGGYQGRTGSVAVTNTDNDAAGITVGAPSGTSTSEAGTSVTFTVVLSSQPTADVTVPLSSNDTTEATVSPASLVFTAADWNTPKVVTVTGVDDLLADGTQPYTVVLGTATSTDPSYGNQNPADFTFSNTDNDDAGLVTTASSGPTTEAGGQATFRLKLSSQPTADVVVTLSSSDTSEGTVSPASVTFTTTSWSVEQAVTVTGVDDLVADGAIPYTVQLSAASSDAGYQGRTGSVAVTNSDNDLAGITVGVPSGISTTEGGTSVTFTVVLSSQPTADVTVPISSLDMTEGTVSPASLVFTAANWSAPQTVTVTGVDDFLADGIQAYTVAIGPATSGDATYAGADPNDLLLTNTDDDMAGLVATPSSGLVTTEASGPAATFQLKLSSQPTADVVVTVSSSDTTEGTVSPSSFTFTAASWNVAQTVTVTGVDDALADGAIAYTVQLTAASSDGGYQGRTGSVAVTNQDNDVTGLVATPSSGLLTTEAGGPAATFQLKLSSQPTADVVVTVSSSDTTEGTVSPASITFTAANWSVAQTVTVTGVDDLVVDGAIAYTVQLTAASSDAGYSGRTGSVAVTNSDDDAAGITVSAPSGTSTSETGTSVTFTVVLTSQPTADVTVPLSSSDTTEATVSAASLTFTAGNWSTPQTVTVTGVDDLLADGTQTYTVAIGTAASADASYANQNPADFTFSNLDNDAAGLVATPATGLSTTEAGATATFQLKLSSQPTQDVVVAVSSSDATEGTAAPANVTFTNGNWNTPQTITVTGVDDALADGVIAYTVELSATSTDTGYQGRTGSVAVTNNDNDAAGITVGTPSGTSTSESGTSVTFTVVLTSQPTANVAIPLSSLDATEGTVSPASLVFTTANWSTPQTVTVTGVDDASADGTQTYSVAIEPATSTDTNYAGKDPADLGFTNTDNDTAGLVATPSSGLLTTEAGGTATFQLTLSSQPTQDVVVAVTSSDTTEGSVSPASVTFTTANWSAAQTVTVTGLDDAAVDGAVGYTVQLSATSTDAGYGGRSGSVSVTNSDNDAAGITVGAPSGTSTSELGTSVTFTVVLTSQPTANVTVPVSSLDTTEGSVSPANVVFTTANWDTPQTVTVTGVDDAMADGTQPYTVAIGPATSADTNYAGQNPADFIFTNTDNDVAGLVATPSSGLVTTEAGGTATFQLVLTSQPTTNVVVAVSSSDTTEGTVSPASVTFTAASWNVAQTVTVTGVDDLVADGAIAYAVQLSASGDAGYQGRTGSVSVTNSDNDAAGIAVGVPSGTSTSEAGTAVTFTVVLTSQPTSDVTVPVSSSDTTEGTVSPAGVVFTAANWNTPQTVTVTGVDDAMADGPQTYTVAIGTAISADTGYAGQNPADFTFTNLDNDTAGLVATPSSGLVTTEAGGQATFQLTLSSQPTADVLVSLSSSDTTEGTVSPASVTFTAANWSAPQTVTVTGVNDLVADGAIAYTVELSAASTDAGYSGRTGSVAVTNNDNDTAGITVGTPSGTSTSEAGTSVTFTVVLTSQPTADVTVPLASSDTTEGTVSPTSVVFTAANWSAAQTVTVTGVNDAVADGTQPYTVEIGTATSADANYAGKDPADLGFTNTDNDVAGLVATPSSGLSTTEAGGTATFQLTLASQPTTDVVVAVSSSDTSEGTVAPASVTFTTSNWNVAQTVTLTGVDDLVADGTIAYAVQLSAASSDTGYSGRTGSVTATNSDNDLAGITVGVPSGISTSEAGMSVTFTVVLNSQPTADVTVPISSLDTTEGTVSPASLVFSAANWNTPQTVTVTGADDFVADGTQPYTVAIGPATGGDATYAGIDPADLFFTNTDDDVAGLVASPSSGLVTTEGAGTATFQLKLYSEPTADVVVAISSSKITEGTVAPASVTFTATNWNVAQSVTVTGVDDPVADGAIAYTVDLSATSTDGGYGGRTASVSVTNQDNDAAGLVATPSSGLVTTPIDQATFQLKLSSQPNADVVVAVLSSDPTEGTVSPASVTFTPDNWNVAQTVTVTGIDDGSGDGLVPYTIELSATSADAGYEGRNGSVSVNDGGPV